jgi:hypothetical protein
MILRNSLSGGQVVLTQCSFAVSQNAASLSWGGSRFLFSELTSSVLWEALWEFRSQLAGCSAEVTSGSTVRQGSQAHQTLDSLAANVPQAIMPAH